MFWLASGTQQGGTAKYHRAIPLTVSLLCLQTGCMLAPRTFLCPHNIRQFRKLNATTWQTLRGFLQFQAGRTGPQTLVFFFFFSNVEPTSGSLVIIGTSSSANLLAKFHSDSNTPFFRRDCRVGDWTLAAITPFKSVTVSLHPGVRF